MEGTNAKKTIQIILEDCTDDFVCSKDINQIGIHMKIRKCKCAYAYIPSWNNFNLNMKVNTKLVTIEEDMCVCVSVCVCVWERERGGKKRNKGYPEKNKSRLAFCE